MKKTLSLAFALALAFGAVLTGCGGKASAQVDVAALADELKDGLTFQDELKEIEASILDNFYPTVDQSTLKAFKVYKSASGSTAEEIAVFEANDGDAAKAVEAAVKSRLEDLTQQCDGYLPAEMKKIEGAINKTYGSIVVLVVADDDGAAQKILDRHF